MGSTMTAGLPGATREWESGSGSNRGQIEVLCRGAAPGSVRWRTGVYPTFQNLENLFRRDLPAADEDASELLAPPGPPLFFQRLLEISRIDEIELHQ